MMTDMSYGFETRVTVQRDVCGGEPCIKGTRIPVHVVLDHLAAGDDPATILQNFPRLTTDDIRACIEFASYWVREKSAPPCAS